MFCFSLKAERGAVGLHACFSADSDGTALLFLSSVQRAVCSPSVSFTLRATSWAIEQGVVAVIRQRQQLRVQRASSLRRPFQRALIVARV